MTPGKKFEAMVAGDEKTAQTEYVLRGVVSYVLGGFIAFPEPVRKQVTESDSFTQELASPKTKYAVMFEQEFSISPGGNVGRALRLMYLVDDSPIVPTEDPDEMFEDTPSVPDHSLGQLEDIFSATELEDLFKRTEAVVQAERGVGICEKLHDNIAAISGASRMRQLEMISTLLTQFNGTAERAATDDGYGH